MHGSKGPHIKDSQMMTYNKADAGKILSVFEQPSRDNHVYVVVQGQVGDIACYRDSYASGLVPERIRAMGDKLTEAEFRKTLGCWNFEADGLHYRK